jgi:hypothetical protein
MESAIRKAFYSSFKSYEFTEEEKEEVSKKLDELFDTYRSITGSKINKKWKGFLKECRNEL